MIEVCFPHSYTQKKTADLAGSAVFLFENLLQASRLVIHPRFHTADIIGLYGTVTDMAAVVILHSCRSHPNSRCNVIFIGYCLRRCHTYHLLLPRHGHEKSSRDRNRSGEHVICYSGGTGRISDSLFYHLYGILSCECDHHDPRHLQRKDTSSPLDVADQPVYLQDPAEPCRENEHCRVLERHRLLQYEPGSLNYFPCVDAGVAAPPMSGAADPCSASYQQVTMPKSEIPEGHHIQSP